MDYRSLGRTGVMVTPLCLGAMNFGNPTDEKTSINIINKAGDGGVNFIDTANVYNAGESERIVGKALKENGKRAAIVLATKVNGAMGPGPNDRGITRYHIMSACEDSLRRLQTDHIDLYQIHRPSFTVPQDETLRALDDLVRQGKVRYIGSSTFPAWKLMEALAVSEQLGLARYVTEQPPYNFLDRRIENELVPLSLAHGVGLLPWSPLAGGVLAGRYQPGQQAPTDSRLTRSGAFFSDRVTPRAVEAAHRVADLARERRLTVAQLALLWVKDQPGVTAPIIGPRTLEQLADLLPVLEMKLSDEDRAAMDAINPPGSAITDFHNTSGWMKTRLA
jgi:aryl-alcohol dehydrogenase-like predicted oxidoreductase